MLLLRQSFIITLDIAAAAAAAATAAAAADHGDDDTAMTITWQYL